MLIRTETSGYYTPRKQFIDFHRRLPLIKVDGGYIVPKEGPYKGRFAAMVCHRRAGKTVASVNDLQDYALSCAHVRPRVAYIAPFLKQAKNVAWDHARAAAATLGQSRYEVNEAELRIDYFNGSRLRLYGADNPDALRGIYLDAVVMDEYADMDPRLWPEVIRPALSDRNGWAVFIGTPRGHNAFYIIAKEAAKNPDWFFKVLKASETGILPADELESIKREQTPEQYDQEYECSFEAAIQGAYYAKLIEDAENAGRITSVPWDPSIPVWTGWDLGFTDSTAIWFAQIVGKEIHIIDYYETSRQHLGVICRELNSRPYVYQTHLLPIDAEAHELGTGKTRVETLSSLGFPNVRIIPKHEILDGINAVRLLIPKCYFDKANCMRGIEALRQYRSDVDRRFIDPDTKQPIAKPKPVHDWTSHAADAKRYLAMGIDDKGFGKQFYGPINYPKMGWM